MKTSRIHSCRLVRTVAALSLPALLAAFANAQTTGFNKNGVGPFDYNTTGNWVGGAINGIWDSTLDIAATQTITFAADTPLTTGLTFGYTGGGNLTLKGTGANRTLTLAGDILHNTATGRTITIGSSTSNENLNVNLGGTTRTFTVGSGRALTFANTISNGGLILNGSLTFTGVNTYAGTTTINSGSIGFNGGSGSAANSDVTIKTNGAAVTTLSFGSGGTGTGVTRAKSITLDGSSSQANNTAILSVSGNATNNSIEAITGNLGVTQGFGIVSLSPNSAKNTRLTAATFSREVGSAVLFRGTNLGVNTAASQTANSSNILFAAAPTLTGGTGGAGTSTVKILKGAVGDITNNGTGSGLVTYDSTHGIRLLDTTSEYTATITDEQTALDNVRLVGEDLSTVTGKTVTITGDTTINSLSLIQATATANKNGVIVTSTGTDTMLTIGSGMIFSTINNTNSGDELQINTAKLGFNNQEAIIYTAGSSGSGSSNLTISSEITAASSFTKSGNGVLKITGATDNTYTGETIMAGGTLELGKTDGKNALGGHLTVNAGTVYLTNANQIADTKDITVNGGVMQFSASGVNSRDETFRNLILTGGSVNTGTVGGNNTNTVSLTDATLTGGALTVTRKSLMNASGLVSVSGGATITVDRYNTTDTTKKTALSVGTGGLVITQSATADYTPVTLTGGNAAGVKGGELILNGDVTFTSTGSSTHTTTIATLAPTSGGGEGLILLNGTRTFTIANGGATNDLTVNAALTNGTSTGGLIKSGTGTLLLTAANSYTGATIVNQGTLALSGSGALNTASALTVAAGATFDTSAQAGYVFNTSGVTTIGVSASAAGQIKAATATFSNAALVFDFGNTTSFASSYDILIVSGLETGHFTSVTASGTSISGSFLDLTNSGIWTFSTDDGTFTFNEDSGKLTYSAVAVPEPSTAALLAGTVLLGFATLRRRSRSA